MEQQLLQAIDLASGGGQAGQNGNLVQEALGFLEQVKQNTDQVWSAAWTIFTARDSTNGRPAYNDTQRMFCLNLVSLFLEEG